MVIFSAGVWFVEDSKRGIEMGISLMLLKRCTAAGLGLAEGG
jgi:hypothetical protein